MELSKTVLTESVLPPDIMPHTKGIEGASDEQKKKIAQDFESILLGKLLDEMNNTIGDWGEEKDQATGQIKGIFNLYMSQHIGSNGGFGLWKDIYESLSRMEQSQANQVDLIDKQI